MANGDWWNPNGPGRLGSLRPSRPRDQSKSPVPNGIDSSDVVNADW